MTLSNTKTAAQNSVLFASRFAFGAIVLNSLLPVVVLAADPRPAATPVAALETRLDRIERLINNQNLVQMFTQQQSLQQEISSLRGEVELLGHELKNVIKQQKDLYLEFDQRIQETEKNIVSLRSSSPAPLSATPNAAEALEQGATKAAESKPLTGDNSASSSSTAESNLQDQAPEQVQENLTEQESYQASLEMLKNSQYQEAISGFQIFLISYPLSDYAANAQYWMAEAYYVLKDHRSAISHFSKVISAYPNSNKSSDAHLKIGLSFYELKDWASAQKAFEKVLADFPSSSAARIAERRLQKMKLEGNI